VNSVQFNAFLDRWAVVCACDLSPRECVSALVINLGLCSIFKIYCSLVLDFYLAHASLRVPLYLLTYVVCSARLDDLNDL